MTGANRITELVKKIQEALHEKLYIPFKPFSVRCVTVPQKFRTPSGNISVRPHSRSPIVSSGSWKDTRGVSVDTNKDLHRLLRRPHCRWWPRGMCSSHPANDNGKYSLSMAFTWSNDNRYLGALSQQTHSPTGTFRSGVSSLLSTIDDMPLSLSINSISSGSESIYIFLTQL